MHITIRLAQPGDAPAMAKIHADAWTAAYHGILPADYIRKKNAARPALLKNALLNGNTSRYVIEADGTIVGILCVAPPQEEAGESKGETCLELHHIYLHPTCFRQGIGTKAVNYALDIAKNAGKTEMITWVFAENTSAIHFYKACGFAFDGTTKTRDCGNMTQCIRMRRKV